MSATQIHDMLQRQIVAEGGGSLQGGERYGIEGYGLQGGVRRRASKKEFPDVAKAGLCEYRLFQSEHKGLSRAELSEKWAQHKARTGGRLMGAGMSGGAREFGDDVSGHCVYQRFRNERPDISRKALKKRWATAKTRYFESHGSALEGGCGECMEPAGGIKSIKKRFEGVRERHPKASRARLMKLYEFARKAYYRQIAKIAERKRRSTLSKKSPLKRHSIEELIQLCMEHAETGEIPHEIVSAVAAHPELTPELGAELMEIAESMPIPAAEKIAELAGVVSEEMKTPEAPVAPTPTESEQTAALHAAAELLKSPEAASNPKAAKAVIKAAKPRSFLSELKTRSKALAEKRAMTANPFYTLSGKELKAQRDAAAEAAAAAEAELAEQGAEEVLAGSALIGGRMSAAAKKAYLRKCMRR